MKAISKVFEVIDQISKWLKVVQVLEAGLDAMKQKAVELNLIEKKDETE